MTTEHDCPICEGKNTVIEKYGDARCYRCPSRFTVLDGELVATQSATVRMKGPSQRRRRTRVRR